MGSSSLITIQSATYFPGCIDLNNPSSTGINCLNRFPVTFHKIEVFFVSNEIFCIIEAANKVHSSYLGPIGIAQISATLPIKLIAKINFC